VTQRLTDHRWPLTLIHFVGKVISGFRANHGFLLVSAVAYNGLLSIIPMLTVILVLLSQMLDQQTLLSTVRTYLKLVTPDQAGPIADQVQSFLDHWKIIGTVGSVALLFFSSLAFSVLDSAMGVIFHHRRSVTGGRPFIVNVLIPFMFILLLAAGLLAVSVINLALQHLSVGHSWSVDTATGYIAFLLGLLGELVLFTSIYIVMPTGRVSLKHAALGGVVATGLWEPTRYLLTWYLTNISNVNVIYGSFATVVVILVTLEMGAFIILLGAQVIAEYEMTLRWSFPHDDHAGSKQRPPPAKHLQLASATRPIAPLK
jgi:membrane protein